jgi:hypothetical protein
MNFTYATHAQRIQSAFAAWVPALCSIGISSKRMRCTEARDRGNVHGNGIINS